MQKMEALGLVFSNKMFENCIFKIYFPTPRPTFANNRNHLNNSGRGPPKDHFFVIQEEVSKERVLK